LEQGLEQDHGWIALHRKVIYSWIWDDPLFFRAWCDIIISVNHQEKTVRIGNRIVDCKRGESLRSMATWSKRWEMGRSKTRRYIKLLKESKMIEIIPTKGTTHLKVCNYMFYQDLRIANEPQVNLKRTSSEPQVNTTKQGNNENNETIKQLKESLSVLFEKEFWPEYPKKGDPY